jgi:predicted Rdx family selenoprotein
MAVDIRNKYGIATELKEGHGGIFEVTIDDQVIYTNEGQCGHLPDSEQVSQRILEYKQNGVIGHNELPSVEGHT